MLEYLDAEPLILYQSGNPCARAYSRAEKERNWPGCMFLCEWIIMRPMLPPPRARTLRVSFMTAPSTGVACRHNHSQTNRLHERRARPPTRS